MGFVKFIIIIHVIVGKKNSGKTFCYKKLKI